VYVKSLHPPTLWWALRDHRAGKLSKQDERRMQGHASSEDGKIEDAARDGKEEIKRLAVDDVRRRMQTVATHYLEDCRLYFC